MERYKYQLNLLTNMEREVLQTLLDHKKVSILKTLYDSPEDMYLREIAKKSKVSIGSVHRILQALEMIGIIRSKEVGMMKFYGLVKNGKSKFLDDWFQQEDHLGYFVKELQGLEGLNNIILHGKADKHKASLILIGDNPDKQIIESIKDEVMIKGFDISYVILNDDQYEKLANMGLYGGEKKVLL